MNDTNNTPDAVREAVTEFRNRVVRLLHEMYNECTHSDTEAFAYERAEKEVRALMLPTALDSRAGDAGEGLTVAQRAARIKFSGYGVWWNGLTDHQRKIASLDNAFLAGVTAALLATPAPAVDDDDIDSPAARLDMVRVALSGIIHNPASAVALARAGLDFCDMTEAQRVEMRGDAPAVDTQYDDEAPCKDCEDTGITIQTERACSCDAGDQYRAPAVDAVPAGEVEQ